MRKKKPKWIPHNKTSVRVKLCHFPEVQLFVSQNGRGWWDWRLVVSNEIVSDGQGGSRPEAEQCAIARVKEFLKEIEAACPE